MELLFIVDPLETLQPDHDTSVALMEVAQSRGYSVYTTTMNDLMVTPHGATARCTSIFVDAEDGRDPANRSSETWYQAYEFASRELNDMDAIIVRTDPPVDDAYIRGTYILDQVDSRQTALVNSPSGLREVNEKLFTLRFPQLIPETFVSSHRQTLHDAVHEWKKAVIKPTDAMAGRGIFLLRAGDLNLGSIIDTATSFGTKHVILQRYVEDSTCGGDRRVIVVGGEPKAALLRTARPGEFRCNMAVGASAGYTDVLPEDHWICEVIEPELDRLGILFAGIDVIGDRLIEVNVTSPTGLREIENLSDSGIAAKVVDAIEAAVGGLS